VDALESSRVIVSRRVADKSGDATGVEDAIKITTGGLSSIAKLVAGRLNISAPAS